MKRFICIIFFILLTSTIHAQLTNTSIYTWENISGDSFSGQTNLITQFYKFIVTYNNFYLDLQLSGLHSYNNVNNAFPGSTVNLAHYINMAGSSNENKGVALRLGSIPSGITAELIRSGSSITNTSPIASGSSYDYQLRVTIADNYQGNSFSINITNTGSTNSSPFPYKVVVQHRFNVIHQDVMVDHATDGIHTINVFDGSQPLGNLKVKIFVRIQGMIVDSESVKIYYDMNVAPDGSSPNVNNNRVISLTKEGNFWVGFISETDPEVKVGNIVNFIVSVDNNLYYNNGEPWRYIIREYAVQKESEDTISVNNKINPSLGEKYYLIYKLNRKSFVNISIYNIRGELVRKLKNEEVNIGKHFVEWDGRNDAGNLVAMGLYMACVQTSEYGDIRKIIVIKR